MESKQSCQVCIVKQHKSSKTPPTPKERKKRKEIESSFPTCTRKFVANDSLIVRFSISSTIPITFLINPLSKSILNLATSALLSVYAHSLTHNARRMSNAFTLLHSIIHPRRAWNLIDCMAIPSYQMK